MYEVFTTIPSLLLPIFVASPLSKSWKQHVGVFLTALFSFHFVSQVCLFLSDSYASEIVLGTADPKTNKISFLLFWSPKACWRVDTCEFQPTPRIRRFETREEARADCKGAWIPSREPLRFSEGTATEFQAFQFIILKILCSQNEHMCMIGSTDKQKNIRNLTISKCSFKEN